MKVLGMRTISCQDCQENNLEHIGLALMDDGAMYLIGVCPVCRDICTVTVDKIEWQLRNQLGTEPRGN